MYEYGLKNKKKEPKIWIMQLDKQTHQWVNEDVHLLRSSTLQQRQMILFYCFHSSYRRESKQSGTHLGATIFFVMACFLWISSKETETKCTWRLTDQTLATIFLLYNLLIVPLWVKSNMSGYRSVEHVRAAPGGAATSPRHAASASRALGRGFAR